MRSASSAKSLISKVLLGAVVCVPLVFGALPALASDAAGKFTVRGVGSNPCSAVQASLKSNDKIAGSLYLSWLMGYASAYNRHVPQTFDILPTSAGGDLLGIVMAVCRVSPNASLETATAQSLSAVAAMRLTRETPIVKVTADGKTVEIRQEALTNLQQNLSEKGLYRGPVNGVSSPALVAAIKAIQTREKLEVTGLPDIDTMIRAILKK
jgi:hypothetical protein